MEEVNQYTQPLMRASAFHETLELRRLEPELIEDGQDIALQDTYRRAHIETRSDNNQFYKSHNHNQ